MQHATGWKWRPSLAGTFCALGIALTAWSSVQGQTLADATRPVPRANRIQPAEIGQAAPTDATLSDEAAAAPQKKSWTNWLPWQRDKQPPAAEVSRGSASELPSTGKSATVNRPSSPRGRDRHFPPPQPVTDPEVIASVQSAPATAPAKAPKKKKSLLQSLRKPSWLPFGQREEVVEDQPIGDDRQPASSGARPTNVVEYPDVVPPKYRTGTMSGTRPAYRDEPSAASRPASNAMANDQPPRVQRQVPETDAAQAGTDSRSTEQPRNESLPSATPSLVRSFRRPPPDPVPALPEDSDTQVVTANKPATAAAIAPTAKPTVETGTSPPGSTGAAASSDQSSGEIAANRSVPIMLQSVPQGDQSTDQPTADQTAADQTTGGLHFVPTDLAARDRANRASAAAQSGMSNAKPASSSIDASRATESSVAQSGAETPSATWTAKRLATTAGNPAVTGTHPASNDSTEITATGNRTTKIDAVNSGSMPGQAAWQINPFAPPPASRMATWPDTGPRRMASNKQATPPVALRPLPAGSVANRAAEGAEVNTVRTDSMERTAIEKTPSQIQPSMTTRVSAVEPVDATRDQAVEPVATDTPVESTQPSVVNAANTSEAAELPDLSEPSSVPEMTEPLPESRASSDPAGSWVDAYRQLMQRNGQTYRRPAAGSPTRRLSSDDAPAAPVRRR